MDVPDYGPLFRSACGADSRWKLYVVCKKSRILKQFSTEKAKSRETVFSDTGNRVHATFREQDLAALGSWFGFGGSLLSEWGEV